MLIISLVGCLCFFNKGTAQFTTYGVDFYTGVIDFYQTRLTVTTLSTVQVQFTIETGTGWSHTGNVSVDSPAIVVLPYNIRVYIVEITLSDIKEYISTLIYRYQLLCFMCLLIIIFSIL